MVLHRNRFWAAAVYLGILGFWLGGCGGKKQPSIGSSEDLPLGKDTKSDLLPGFEETRVSVSSDSIVVTGLGNVSSPAFALEAAVYKVTFGFRGKPSDRFSAEVSSNSDIPPFDATLLSGFSKEMSGWCRESRIFKWYRNSRATLSVTAVAEWKIVFEKFPVAGTPVSAPVTLSGFGTRVTAPIRMPRGDVRFGIECPDTKQAGFVVTLYDGNTGEKAIQDILASNAEQGSAETGTSYRTEKTVAIPWAPLCVIEVAANGQSRWTIRIDAGP